MIRTILVCAFAFTFSSPASAGFLRWSAEIENDPFSGGMRVTANFMSTLRSGAIIICDTKDPGVLIRTIPGFTYDPALALYQPEIQIAIDGNVFDAGTGETGAVGDQSRTGLKGREVSAMDIG